MKLILWFFVFIFSSYAKDFSYSLIDLEKNKVIVEKNAESPMILASVSKMYTNYFALSTLGENYQFLTEVYYTGEIKAGELIGDLYLKGGGEPYLTAQHLISLIHQIKKAGIQKVSGEFYYDDSFFPKRASLSELGLEDQPDNPAISGLNIEFNRFTLWNYGRETTAPLTYVEILPKKVYSHGLRYHFIENKKGKEIWQVHTEEAKKFKEDIPSKDSGLYAANFMQGLAELQGLKLKNPVAKKLDAKALSLATHKGLPLTRLASLGFEYSNNLIAEAILMAAGKELQKKAVSSNEAASIMLSWYKNKFPQISWEKTKLINGSGLTLENHTTAHQLAKWLSFVQGDVFETRSFWSLLSINSHSGGVEKRLEDPDLAFRVYAKTGSLYYVNNLAGYLIGKSGKRYAFAIFTSHDNRNKLQGENSAKLNKLRQNSRAWYGRSMEKIDELVKEWILKY